MPAHLEPFADSHIARLIARLSTGWSPDLPHLGKITKSTWGDAPGNLVTLELKDQSLHALWRFSTTPQNMRKTEHIIQSSAGKEIRATLEDGSAFSGTAHITRSNTRYNTDTETITDFEIMTTSWSWTAQSKEPVCWIATLDPPLDIPTLGNLLIKVAHYAEGRELQRSSQWGNFVAQTRIDDQPDLILVQARGKHRTKSDIQWLVATRSGEIDTEKVWHTFVSLCFCLGAWTESSLLMGIDANGVVVAINGRRLGRRPKQHSVRHAATPLNFDTSSTWTQDLFQRLAACRDQHFSIALELYLDSLHDNLIGNFLKLHVAINLLAKLTASPVDSENSSPEHQSMPQMSDLRLLFPSTSQIDTDEIFAAQANLGNAASELAINTPNDPLKTVHLVQRIREAFLIAVARIVSYTGPLSAGTPIHPPQVPSHKNFVIDDRVEGRLFVPEWPSFELEEIEKNSLLARVALFAEDLVESTGGDVSGQLTPSIGSTGDIASYDFELALVSLPTVRQTIFTIIANERGLAIHGWEDEPIQISSTTQLYDFLSNVAESDTIRRQVMTLRVYAKAIKARDA